MKKLLDLSTIYVNFMDIFMPSATSHYGSFLPMVHVHVHVHPNLVSI